MTVEKAKKQRGGKNSGLSVKKAASFDFASLDNLIEIIDTLETEEQVPELFENDELLSKSFKSLLSLISTEESSDGFDGGNGFEETAEKVEVNVMEIMTKFLDDGEIDEEEFEDFFTEELGEEEDSDLSEVDSEFSEASVEPTSKPASKESKKLLKQKSKHLKELEMLMEKVDDESDLDGDEFESEDDEDGEEEAVEDDLDDDPVAAYKATKTMDILNDDGEEDSGRLSSFERSQAALKMQITALESENIESGKPWSLRGEINARQRPSDSLLEEAVDFDNLARPVPQITEERSEEIEDVIKRRIGEAAWDDVERKDGRDLTLLNGMAKDQQKSARALLEDVATASPQRSLTQVYEDQASTKLTGHSAHDDATKEKQDELTGLFAKICRHVDGLSGNRFAPKVYVQSDFQIKTLGGSGKK